jgi:hypothetical protein
MAYLGVPVDANEEMFLAIEGYAIVVLKHWIRLQIKGLSNPQISNSSDL